MILLLRGHSGKAALRRFMEERVGLSGDKLEDAFDDLLYGVRSVSSSVEGVLSHFDKRNIRFRSDRDMNRFVELYSQIQQYDADALQPWLHTG